MIKHLYQFIQLIGFVIGALVYLLAVIFLRKEGVRAHSYKPTVKEQIAERKKEQESKYFREMMRLRSIIGQRLMELGYVSEFFEHRDGINIIWTPLGEKEITNIDKLKNDIAIPDITDTKYLQSVVDEFLIESRYRT